ncbi:MAG TPA: anhydro-N-acetylmuramic acid kinase [Bacteroidales bacterium]|nr:anhydro-N-acetylmuramic acid kinase [Bacteroidales bacterium]
MIESQNGIVRNYSVLGVMSGSSLDGLDLAHCQLHKNDQGWYYEIQQATTRSYPRHLSNSLASLNTLTAEELLDLDIRLGAFIGETIRDFILEKQIDTLDCIASHGHTAFHNPARGYSLQIGHGATIAAVTHIPVICDFRSLDVALGGQGAPLVPIGDELFFSDYDYCLNLGGYSNISWQHQGRRLAMDVCPVNKAINLLAHEAGEEMDRNGEMARQGQVHKPLLKALHSLDYYRQPPPKSLADGWFNSEFLKTLRSADHLSLNDRLRTLYEHIAVQIARSTPLLSGGKMLATGGGAHNSFLVECLARQNKNQIVLPDPLLIDYKEALVFALMGALRITGEINCLSSATGARKDSSGGVIHTMKSSIFF